MRERRNGDGKGRRTESQADAEIVRRLEELRFDPRCPEWRAISDVLIGYGYSVFRGWLTGGTVYEAAAAHGGAGVRGLGRIPRGLRLPGDDAHDLTMMLLETAIRRFRLTLQEGRWHAEAGASLATFFIGRCLMELPDVHERWRRQRDRWGRDVMDAPDVDDGRFSVDPSEPAIAAVYLDEILPRDEFEHVRVMFELSQSGYTLVEISDLFTASGIPYSEAAVRSRINRARDRARDHRDREQRDDDHRGDDRGR
jgi:hypothetical protein